MRVKTRCVLKQCVKDSGFCVVYLFGLTVAIAFVTTLIFGGGIVTFALVLAVLAAAVMWYLKACHAPSDRTPLNYGQTDTARDKT